MSNDSQESPSSRPRFYPSQIQIERLKREDEEEHWISGEELYTEGSSDDEEDLKRLTIREPEVRGGAENIGSNSIGAAAATVVGTGRSKLSHPGLPRSAQIANRNLFQPVRHRKTKIDETDSFGNPVISTTAAAVTEEKLYSSSSSKEIYPEVDNSGSSNFTDKEENIPEDVDREEEISWRPKRDDCVPNLIFEESIVELRELQFEYREILDSISELKTSLTEPSNLTNSANDPRETVHNYNNDINGNENSAELILGEETVPDGDQVIEDVSFGDRDVDRWSNAIINTAKIKKEISNIMKLDMCIEELDQKVKKESEDTLKEQISNRKELKRLQILRGAPEAGKLAKNSQLFFNLCSSMEIEAEDQDIESVCTVLPIYQSRNELELEDLQIPDFNEEEEESRKSRREKLEEQLTIIDKRRASFIERNKQLASCAMGSLPITDEEKRRLEELVKDIDDDQGADELNIDRISSADTNSSTPYTIDKEADELLKKLTEQLENINSETYRKSEEENRVCGREELIPHKEQLVINSLRSLAESSSEVIHPISEEEMRKLIDEYYAEEETSSSRISLKDLKSETKEYRISIASQTPTIPKDLINELVKEAKTAMPLFQFKHRTEFIDKLEDKDEERNNSPNNRMNE